MLPPHPCPAPRATRLRGAETPRYTTIYPSPSPEQAVSLALPAFVRAFVAALTDAAPAVTLHATNAAGVRRLAAQCRRPGAACRPARAVAVPLAKNAGNVYLDRETAERWRSYRLHLRRHNADYVSVTIRGRNYYLHRLILRREIRAEARRRGVPEHCVQVHHWDGHGRNCTRANLALATPGENARSRAKRHRASKDSEFVGVFRRSGDSSWMAGICVEGVTYQVGPFSRQHHAARARDLLAILLAGPFAALNGSIDRCPPAGAHAKRRPTRRR